MQDQNKSSVGSIIGTIIIIAIIILGGLYFWGKRIEDNKIKQELISEPVTTSGTEVNEAAAIKSVGTGDDLNTLDNDLQKTNADGLSTELN